MSDEMKFKYVKGDKIRGIHMMEIDEFNHQFEIIQVIINKQNNYAVWCVDEEGFEFLGATKNMRGAKRMVRKFAIVKMIRSHRNSILTEDVIQGE